MQLPTNLFTDFFLIHYLFIQKFNYCEYMLCILDEYLKTNINYVHKISASIYNTLFRHSIPLMEKLLFSNLLEMGYNETCKHLESKLLRIKKCVRVAFTKHYI